MFSFSSVGELNQRRKKTSENYEPSAQHIVPINKQQQK